MKKACKERQSSGWDYTASAGQPVLGRKTRFHCPISGRLSWKFDTMYMRYLQGSNRFPLVLFPLVSYWWFKSRNIFSVQKRQQLIEIFKKSRGDNRVLTTYLMHTSSKFRVRRREIEHGSRVSFFPALSISPWELIFHTNTRLRSSIRGRFLWHLTQGTGRMCEDPPPPFVPYLIFYNESLETEYFRTVFRY